MTSTLYQGAVRLTDWGVIRATGADARKFLHGQLTQDIEHLPADQARLAGFCSAKGRLLASFVVWRHGPDDVLLACSADVLPAVLKRLSMFVLRAQCKLSDASADLPLWGVAGLAATGSPWSRASAEGGDLVRLPDAVVAGQVVTRCLQTCTAEAALSRLDIDTWRGLEVSSGVARVVAATAEKFVPQMVNLELVGGVNFQKGCYPGQEIVARSQYRGSVKRRAYVMGSTARVLPGQEVFHSADAEQPAGMVVLSGMLDGKPVALVELKTAVLDGGTLHAGTVQGPLLTPGALPYEIPAMPVEAA